MNQSSALAQYEAQSQDWRDHYTSANAQMSSEFSRLSADDGQRLNACLHAVILLELEWAAMMCESPSLIQFGSGGADMAALCIRDRIKRLAEKEA